MNIIALLALAFPLEWNTTFRTDVPYEVEVSPAKLGVESFVVRADGKPLDVRTFAGKLPDTLTLRFSVPKGTKALMCEGKGERVKGGRGMN